MGLQDRKKQVSLSLWAHASEFGYLRVIFRIAFLIFSSVRTIALAAVYIGFHFAQKVFGSMHHTVGILHQSFSPTNKLIDIRRDVHCILDRIWRAYPYTIWPD